MPRVRFMAFSSEACFVRHTASRRENASKQQFRAWLPRQSEASKKRGQLVERVKNFQPHENERCDHQIITKMHAGLETNAFRGPCGSRARPSTKLDTRRKGQAPAKDSSATKKKGLRRRGSDAFDAFVTGPLLDRRSLVRRQRPAHTPWKILIPHSTMTMASTSVAAVSTLSKEATLILTLRFPAPLKV